MSQANKVVEALKRKPELLEQVKAKINDPEDDPDWKPNHEGLATKVGKDYAQQCFRHRKENPVEQVDNGRLYAGSSMYYYCKACGWLAETLPESHWGRPKQLCDECQSLKDLGWLE